MGRPSIFDPKDVLDLVGLGASDAFLKSILEKFDAPRRLQDAWAALAEEDLDKLRSAAHAIKGQLKYMAAHTAAESACALEKEATTLEEAHEADKRPWGEEATERLTAMTAALCAHVERVDANRRVVLAELG